MRTGTIVVLLAAILLFAVFGWKAFGVLAATFLILLLAGVATVAIAIWVVKRRMQRKMEELAKAMGEQLRARFDERNVEAGRPGAIDAEGRVVRRPRDGADAPEGPEGHDAAQDRPR